MSGSFESVQWNACEHRLGLGLCSHPKEIMSVFLEQLSMRNMLNCTKQVQIQKYKTHAYNTLKTAGVQIIMLKHPTKHKKRIPLGGLESEPMLTPRKKSPLPEKFSPED